MGTVAFRPFFATVKGAFPERFVIGEIDPTLPSHFMRTSDFLIERDFRAHFEKQNTPLDVIEALVAEARQNAY